jgi:ABC-type Zn uptake system ZnuABC Zn-binding protein ZnuA
MLTIIINKPTLSDMTRSSRRARPPFVAAAVATVAAVALAGCSAQGSGSANESGPSIVATTTQVADFTRELVGESAVVTQLVQPDQSAHSFDPSAQQLVALGRADALVVNGAGLESWLDDAIAASGFDGELIVASEGIELGGGADEHADAADHADGADHADESDHVDEADHADESDHGDESTTSTDHAADDDHAAGDPHVWTDPHNAITMVENIAHGLEALDGQGLDSADLEALAANEEAYVARLEALDEWIHENVDAVPAERRQLVSNHDAFSSFNAAYDVTFVGSIIPSFDDNAEPSAAEIDALVAAIRETGVEAVFSEASISPRAAETIANEAGVAVYAGEDALYADSLGPAGSDGETYVGSQVHNVRRILESWGVTPSELPATLQP